VGVISGAWSGVGVEIGPGVGEDPGVGEGVVKNDQEDKGNSGSIEQPPRTTKDRHRHQRTCQTTRLLRRIITASLREHAVP
jgi:hypothetical protein